jgi:C2 domain
MIFPFKFSIAEDMMITTRKMFDCSREIKMPAILTLQVWDNDSFTPDDFLGTLNINLSHFSRPALTAEKCTLGKRDVLYENLFAIVDRRIRGWFSVRGKSDENGPIKQTVMIIFSFRKKLIELFLGKIRG